METIRVLRIIARMNVGGPALQVAALTQGLGAPRFHSRLLVGRVGPGEADYLELRAPAVEATTIPGLGRSPHAVDDFTALGRIVREIKTFQPHIVHTHTAKAGVLGRVAARICRVPATVHTFHGHLLHGYFSPRVRECVVQAERTLARRTTRLVAVGAKVRDDLLATGIGMRDQFVVVPPGVDLPTPPSPRQARAALGLPLDGPVVGFVARMTAVKRPDRFADVAAELARRLPNVSFLVAGEGELLGVLRARMAPLRDRAHFVGWRRDVETVYAACDVVTITSDNEGMPVSLIEAASVGTPAVTTDVGSAREVVVDGETGFVTSLDAIQIAAALEKLLADPVRKQQMSCACIERARDLFSSARLVRDTARIYEELAEDLGL